VGARFSSARSATTDVVRALVREWQDDRVGGLAAEIAFFGVLSMFPALLAMAAALGALDAIAGHDLASRVEGEVVDFLRTVLTDDASNTVDAVESLFSDTSPGVATLGTAAAVWAASRGFVAVIRGLDLAYDIDEGRGYVRLRALGLALSLGTVAVVSLMLGMLVVGPLLGTGQDVADYVGMGRAFETFWDLARWPTALAAMVAWSATIFHIAPNHRTPWRWDLPGAALTTVAWVALSLALRGYLAAAAGLNQVLGTLGGALIVLLWLYLLAVGLLVGGELNGVLAKRHGVKQLPRGSLRRRRDRPPGVSGAPTGSAGGRA